MLAEIKLNTFRELVKNASKEEVIWMNGFLNGIISEQEKMQPGLSAANRQLSSLSGCTVVYGTETGNSKKVATDFGTKLKKQGVPVKIKSLDQYRVNDIVKESCLLVVMSTQGDGEPPAAAKKFYDYLLQNELSLSHLKYGVLALGDTSYPLFCKAGEDVDTRLNQLGAQRIISLQKCDTDFETDAVEWIDELISSALQPLPDNTFSTVAIKTKTLKAGKKIYTGNIIASINLNDKGSAKETYHIEIATDEEIIYEPGDSIGIVPFNKKNAVDKVLELLELDAEQKIIYRENSYTAFELFTEKINLQYLPERIVQQYAKMVSKEIPAMRMDLADLLRIYPCDKNCGVQQYISILEPIVPRLYSISSSPLSHGENEVHITVSRNNFTVDDHKRFGLCSDFLSELNENDSLQFYVQKNNAFKLPSADTDVIMIGPGTGIAPFRSFLFERDAQGASGRNWLFFGEQHFVSDFLYQTELQSLFETGVLTKLNTAFSRDQKEKIYVQHKMLQHADELFEWISNGANIYLCGAKEPMSVDVENTLVKIIASKGNMDETAAIEYLQALQENEKFHRDVY